MITFLEKKIRINGIIFGLLLGLTLALISIGSFYYILSATQTPKLFILVPAFLTYIVPIILAIIFCFSLRKSIAGFWNFRQATTGIFIMFFMAFLTQMAGHDFVFAKFIEPQLYHKTYLATLAASKEMKKDPKVDKKRVDDNISEIRKNIEEQKKIGVGMIIFGFAINIIFIFVFALIFGALFKREAPVYLPGTSEQ